MKNKKGNNGAILVTVFILVISLTLGMFFYQDLVEKAKNLTEKTLNLESLANKMNINLDITGKEVRFNAIDELDQEFVNYADVVIHQMFDENYSRYDSANNLIYKNKDKSLRYYDYFPTDKNYGIQIHDDGIGLKVYIISELNTPYFYKDYNNWEFLRNKHLSIISGEIKNSISDGTYNSFGSIWVLKKYCKGVVHTQPQQTWHGFETLSDAWSSVDSSWRGQTYLRLEKLKMSKSEDYLKNIANTVYPLTMVGLSRAKDDEDHMQPELYWVKTNENDLENNRIITKAELGHLVLKLDKTESHQLAKLYELENPADAKFFTFFPSLGHTSLNCPAEKGVCVAVAEDKTNIRVDGHGFLFKESTQIIIENIKHCN